MYPASSYIPAPTAPFVDTTAQQSVAAAPNISNAGGAHTYPHYGQPPQGSSGAVPPSGSFMGSGGGAQPYSSFPGPSDSSSHPPVPYPAVPYPAVPSQPKVAIPGLSETTASSFPGSTPSRPPLLSTPGSSHPQNSFMDSSGDAGDKWKSMRNTSFVDNTILGGLTEEEETIPFQLDEEGNPVKVVSLEVCSEIQ